MRESLDQYFVSRYIEELREELFARGVKAELVEGVVAESVGHLQDALEAANPQSAEELRAILARFGPATRLARKFAAEEERRGKRRRFLWPALVTPVFMWLAMHPVPQARLFHDRMYAGTFYILLGGVVLLLLGFRARKPLLGQFAVLTAALIAGQVGWYTATSYPEKHTSMRGMDGYEAVRSTEYSARLARSEAGIANARALGPRLEEGKRFFAAAAAPAHVPSEFTYQGEFWLPEGVREVMLDIPPDKISKSLLTDSWHDAARAWTAKTTAWVSLPAANAMGFRNEVVEGSEADRIIRQIPDQIAWEQSSIASLQWYHTQPRSVLAGAFFRMVAPYTVVFCGMAAACTNVGWLLWLAGRGLGWLRRRLTYGHPRNKSVT